VLKAVFPAFVINISTVFLNSFHCFYKGFALGASGANCQMDAGTIRLGVGDASANYSVIFRTALLCILRTGHAQLLDKGICIVRNKPFGFPKDYGINPQANPQAIYSVSFWKLRPMPLFNV